MQILDTVHEREFDDVVLLAAQLCSVPISTITLVDERRQWFKAAVGLEVRETPREIAFCAVAIAGDGPLVVEDTLLDPRFATNPLVLDRPRLRFYAGFPMVTRDGIAIGTLTVMDHVPRQLAADEREAMQALANQVTSLLEVRARLHRIRAGQATDVLQRDALERQVQLQTAALHEETAHVARVERQFQSLWETTTDAVLMLDDTSVIRYANPGAVALFGHPLQALQGMSLARLQPARLRHAHRAGMAAYVQSGVRRLDWRALETRALHRDGHEVPVELSFSEVGSGDDRLFVGFVRDITRRLQTEAALQSERARAEQTLRCIGDGVVITDAAGRVVAVNPMAERITGWTQADALGRPCEEVLALCFEATGKAVPLPFAIAAGEGADATPLPDASLLLRRDGALVSVEGSVAALSLDEGAVGGWVVAVRDVSQARSLAAQLAHQATHDALTGLVNRGEFDRRLRASLDAARARGARASLLYLDLDQFKIVNDTCGHLAGDEMLTQLAAILQPLLGAGDTLARLGGDEFGVLLDDGPPSRALGVAEALRAAVASFVFVWQGQPFASTVSIGHVALDDGALPAEELLSKADEACYVAKDQGRNRIHSYAPGEEAQALLHREMQWVPRIRQALDEDRFVLYAQPIFSVARPAGPPPHHEVLLRMRDRDGQLVPPMAFLPAAERYDLMPQLDRWVVSTVLREVAAAHDAPESCDAMYAINLSGASVSDPSFAEFILAELAASGLPGRCIGFEVTETAAIANFANAVKLIDALKRAGCAFALDDFGSGLSSFAYLRHLPVDFLKIDGGFVRNVASDPLDRAMVASIHQLGHLMGLCTVAECVEDDATLAALQAIGVDFAQGYGLGRPVPLADCLAHVQR